MIYKVSFKGKEDYTEEFEADDYEYEDNLIIFYRNEKLVKIYSIFNLLNVTPK